MSSDRDTGPIAERNAALEEDARLAQRPHQRTHEELVATQAALSQKTHELERSLAMMSAALDATADGIVATDSHGRITGFNEQYLKMFRLQRALVEGRDHGRIIDQISTQLDDPAAFVARINEIYNTSPPDSFDELHMRDGRVYERFSRVQLVKGEQVGRVWSFRDVTAHMRAQEELRRLNQRLGQRVEERTDALRKSERQFLQLVLSISDVAIYMLDTSGYVTSWNPGAERIKGYTSEEILGKHFSIFYTEEDRAKGLPRQALDTAARKGKYEAESWRVRKDGTRFWANALLDAIHDPHGQLVGFAKITRDMTEWRAMQEQLHQAQKMEAIGQLTGGVAHDFNNLLTVILGNLETISRLSPQENRLKRAVDQATRGAQRAATLTQQLLAFSRRQPLNPKPTEVNRLVSSVSELIRRTLNENIAMETVLGAGVWRIEIDAHQLESALLNLAVNARDAMPSGGKLTIETANTHLDDRYAASYAEIEPGQYVVIQVSDTGSGMSQDVLARAFDPFFTTKPIGEGTGLGLSQVYGFVKQSGGHIKLYSEQGEGTTVKIYLPRYTGGVQDAEIEQQVMVPHGDSSEVILVVEDDEDVRQFSSDSLRELGFSVLEANDGPSALRLLESHRDVKMLFTDVGLPGINGRELVDAARTHQPGLKVLFTSGYARNAIVHQGRLDAGVQLLTKPFTRAQLAARVRDVLDARPEASAEGKVALVVEDEPLVRLFLVQTVEQFGYEVLEAATALQAREEFAAHKDIDVAFIDIGLPDGNGVDLAAKFSAARPRLRIILASGYSQPAYEIANENPQIRFVSKPFDTNAIRAVLAEVEA